MVALFKDRSPATIIWLFLLSIIVHSNFIFETPGVQVLPHDGLLSGFLNNYASLLTPAFVILLYHALIIIQALRLNHLFTDHRMYSKVNFLAAMVYILLTGLFTEWGRLSPALIDNILVIWFFAKTVHLYNSPNPKTLLFNLGLITGCSILLYHPSALLILVAFFALMIVRPFDITEWLVLAMGVIFPFYLLAAYLYLTDRLQSFVQYIPQWELHVPKVHFSIVFFITVGVIIIITLIGLFYSQQENRRLLIQIRKNWTVLLAMLFIMLPLPFVNKNVGIESFLLWLVPATPFIAKGFLAPKKNTLPALMFWSLVALDILKNWEIIK